jgi:hypothetical protein
LILIIGGCAGILLAARLNGLIVAGRRGGRGEEWFNLIEFALGIGSTFCLIGGGLLLMALAIWYWYLTAVRRNFSRLSAVTVPVPMM